MRVLRHEHPAKKSMFTVAAGDTRRFLPLAKDAYDPRARLRSTGVSVGVEARRAHLAEKAGVLRVPGVRRRFDAVGDRLFVDPAVVVKIVLLLVPALDGQLGEIAETASVTIAAAAATVF